MALTTLQIIEVRSAVIFGQSNINAMIAYAEEQLDEACWGDKYANAVALLTMHNYTVDSRGGAGGPVTSEKEGQLSRSFAATASASSYGSTSWGQELQTLSRSINFGPRNRMMTGCPDLS